ncbi:RagB/SusD family nutrient uptake outer membrane protein, partial [Arachidicoccus sp.]|uniref:RagB/SusD family nutrient uptake outer membrane protein n=1 Tax=Arachidicoccus sp. TaxID=1872624 RepID=UPI003D209965
NESKLIPAAAGGATTSLQISTWNFSYVRRVDIMLDNIDQSNMSQSDKDHWRSVGYFFRALRYYDLIAAFGDVPWIEHSLSDTSASVLYGNRTSRDTVAQNILNNLIWAENHIKPSGEGANTNTINQSCVQFLISRFGLFEGTWRKYHGLSNANTYLQACVTYSQKLMVTYPTLMSSYDDVFNSEDLSGGKPGIILYKQYVNTIYNNPQLTRYTGSTAWNSEVPKSAIESFLCTDGKPVSTSAVYMGDDSMYASFKNRDRRLYYDVIPPYSVKFINPAITNQSGNSDNLWTYDQNPNYAYFIHYMNDSISGNTNKKLPVISQTNDMASGNVIPNFPHFSSYNVALSQLPTNAVAISQMVGKLGYFFWKFYNRLPMDGSSNYGGTQDCPLFRMGEVLINYAEASFELGQFSQSIADQTINVLRQRANPTNWPAMKMVVANISGNFDLNRDPSVDPVLWEIRRERRVELFGDGFRFNDLKRWDKGTYMNDYQLGVKIYDKNRMYPNIKIGSTQLKNANILIDGGGNSGYVRNEPVPIGWLDKYYLEPVPAQEIAINPNLTQNPSW